MKRRFLAVDPRRSMTTSSLSLLLVGLLFLGHTQAWVPSGIRPARQAVTMSASSEGYQAALAKARALKAAKGQQQAPRSPAASFTSPAPAAASAAVAPPRPPAAAPVSPPAPAASPLPQEIQDAVGVMLEILRQRVQSGKPLAPEKLSEFERASKLVIGEARMSQVTLGGASVPPPAAAAPTTSIPAVPMTQQRTEREKEEEPYFVAPSFDVEEEHDWSEPSVSLKGPAPGYKPAGMFMLPTAFEEEVDWDTSKVPEPVARGSKGRSFMEGLKGGMFHVENAMDMTEEEYRAEIGRRVQDMQSERRMSGKAVGSQSAWEYMEMLKKAPTQASEEAQQQQQH